MGARPASGSLRRRPKKPLVPAVAVSLNSHSIRSFRACHAQSLPAGRPKFGRSARLRSARHVSGLYGREPREARRSSPSFMLNGRSICASMAAHRDREAGMAEAAIDRGDTEDLRRRQLIQATIESLADVGFADCTLGDIARRAGRLAGPRRPLFRRQGRPARGDPARHGGAPRPRRPRRASRAARTPARPRPGGDRRQPRAGGVRPAHVSVWLAFWGQVLHSARFRRVQNVYQRRMLSNLRHALKQAVPAAGRRDDRAWRSRR